MKKKKPAISPLELFYRMFDIAAMRLSRALFLLTFFLTTLLRAEPGGAQSGVRPSDSGVHRAAFLATEEDSGNARWDLIEGENEEIFAAFFIWEADKIGAAALAGLREAAKRGAKARVILDSWAFEQWHVPRPDAATLEALRQDGVEVRFFNNIDRKSLLNRYNPESYKLLHDKLLYFKRQNIAVTGDRNMANVNYSLRRKRNGAHTRSFTSVEMLAQGPAVEDAKAYLEDLWKVSTPEVSNVPPEEVDRARRNLDRYVKIMRNSGHVRQDWGAALEPVEKIELLADVVGKKGEVFPADEKFVEMIDSSRTRVLLASPFANLIEPLEAALVRAAKRGVEVVVVVPTFEASIGKRVSALLFEPQGLRLQRAGVEVYGHEGRHSMHVKMLQVDDAQTYIGSHNFNPRSAYADTESGFVVTNEKFALQAADYLKWIVSTGGEKYHPIQKSLDDICKQAFLRLASYVPNLYHQF